MSEGVNPTSCNFFSNKVTGAFVVLQYSSANSVHSPMPLCAYCNISSFYKLVITCNKFPQLQPP